MHSNIYGRFWGLGNRATIVLHIVITFQLFLQRFMGRQAKAVIHPVSVVFVADDLVIKSLMLID